MGARGSMDLKVLDKDFSCYGYLISSTLFVFDCVEFFNKAIQLFNEDKKNKML